MTEQKYYTILTEVGKAKIANATAMGGKVKFTKMQLGDGGGSQYDPQEKQTELKNKVWEGNISNIKIDENNSNWIVVETAIPGSAGGFTVREVGILDDEGNLLAIGKYPETYKPTVDDGCAKDLFVRVILMVVNTSTITLKIDPTVILASMKNLEDLRKELNTKIDNTKTDLEKKIEKVQTELDTIELTGNKVTIEDTDNNFVSGTVEGALKELATNDKALDKRIDDTNTNLTKKIETVETDLKQSVSSGKQLIATAITGKDTPTYGSDSFATMAGNADLLRSKLADTIAVKGIEASGSESFDNLRDKVNNIVAIIGCSSGDSSIIESIDLNKSSGSSEVYLDELINTPYSGSYRINGFVRSNNGRISYFRVEHIRDGKIILNKSVEYQDSYKSGVTVSVDISDVVKGDSFKTYLRNGYPSGQTETCYKIYLSCDLLLG